MKRLIAILLGVVFLCTACATATDPVEIDPSSTATGDEVTGDEQGIVSAQSGLTSPTPEPTIALTPFPDAEVTAKTDYGITVEKGCELKNSPEADGAVLKELDAGSEVEVTGTYGDEWLRVSVDSVSGYISVDALANARGFINATDVKLRKGPGTRYDIELLTTINTNLYILDQEGDWYKVVLETDNGESGYMHIDYVSFKSGYILKNGVNMRSLPGENGEIVTKLESGKRVEILFSHNGWLRVDTEEESGYIRADFILESPAVTPLEKQRGYIVDSGVNFRAGAAIGFPVLEKLYKYSPVYITGETVEWYRVMCNDVEGFVMKDFVEIGTPTVYVTGQDVNLRSGPGTGYDLLTKVRQNSEFVIIGREGEWFKGEVCGNVGYIRGDMLNTERVGDGKVDIEFTDAEVLLAAKVVYLEARGTGKDAYRAVANVIYNRVKSRRFPNNVHDVIFQKNQFSVIHHSNFDNLTPSNAALNATREVLQQGVRPMPFNVLFFHAKHLGTHWGNDKEFYKTVGSNSFFRWVG